MDWIKVKTTHILYEYNDLRDSEFRAWIIIMALTAALEHIPTREQMLQYVHYKTLDSLQCKLNTHSIDLQYILNKVSMDVQYVSNRREALKKNTQRYRELHKPVIDDVIITSSVKIREDKIREDILPEAKISFSHKERKFSGIIKSHFELWEPAYPAVNIDTELAKMEVWLLANPKNRKSNYERFISNWLTRAQDKAVRA